MDETGPLSVNVPHEVSVKLSPSSARVIFEEGQQRLPAEFLVQLLYTVGLEGDDEELGARHLAFWDALLESFTEEPGKLGAAFERAGDSLVTNAEPGKIADQMRELVTLDGIDRSIVLLPVQQVSVGGSEMYATEREELVAFLEDTIGEAGTPPEQIEVQVLNGNGRPGVGEKVAERLIGHGFRVVLSSNAPNFDYEKTLIITYEDSEQSDAIAEEARRLIGMGEVQVSAQSQGIVDLTIVVGKDFLRTL
jgi:nucleotide-binding universal stress UspA family protein